MQLGGRCLGLLALVLAPAGCTRTLTAATTQPNPINYPQDMLRQSQRLNIDIKDMDFPRSFFLRQSAYFAVVSKDRVRFHVQLVHKWEEVADITTWHAKLVDDQGHVYYPEAAEKRYDDHVGTRMWEEEQRMIGHDPLGPAGNRDGIRDGTYITGNDGRQHEVRMQALPLQGVDVFQGNGDYMFHAPGMFNKKVKSLTLIMQRDTGTMEYKFVWHLEDPPGGPAVEATAKQ